MVVGIDLGTTNTLACYFVNGRKKLLKFAGGATMLPSVIFTDEADNVIVGQAAQSRGIMEPNRMIRSAKTYIGNFEQNKTWKCGNRIYTPTDVATEVLKEVRRRLVRNMHLDENEEIGAVITVPAYFNDNQRDETRKAGINAGFKVLWILEEPMAAAIEAVHEKQLDKKVFVVDIGGGTFDLSILEADHANHVYTAIAIDGDDRLGGDDFDKAIQRELIRRLEEDTGIIFTNAKSAGLDEGDYNSLMNRLLVEARRAKEELSGDGVLDCPITLPNLTTIGGQPYDLDFVLTRKAMEKTCRPLFERIFNQINNFVTKNADLFTLEDIGHVILAGGTCFIPYIKERIERDIGLKPDDELPLSQLVVSGAARVAESKSGGLESGDTVNLKSILAHSLGIEILDKSGRLVFDKILEKNTLYSECKSVQLYRTTRDNQTQIEINVYEAGKDENVNDLNSQRFRGSLNLEVPPAPKGKETVSVKFDYSDGQQLKVTVTDSRGHSKSAVFNKESKAAPTKSAAEPIDMVLMLDSSESMKYDMPQAKSACRKLITEMFDLDVHRLALMNFDDTARMICHLTNDRQALTNGLNNIVVNGCTETIQALNTAYNELENSSRKKVALFVTDGYPTDNRTRAISRAQKIRKNGIEIFAVGVGKDFDKNFLNNMVGAENSFTIETMTELAAIFEKVIDKITK